MSYEISKKNRNDKRNLSDLEWVDELYYFLQNTENPDGMRISRNSQPRLTERSAYTVIWFLQEHLRVLPDNIERCNTCGSLFDSWESGLSIGIARL